MTTRIKKTDLARDALYDKVNTMIDEVNTKIDNKDSLPSQTGNAGKFLTTDGTNASWGEVKQIEIKQDLTNPSADTVPSTKAVKDESSRITTLMNNLLSTLYPVGSIYIGTQNSCPLATLIAGSQWQKVATQVVTNVNTGVAVYGNGKTLGLTDNSKNYGIMSRNVSNVYGFVFATTNATDKNNGTSVSDNGTANANLCLGVRTQANNSGLTGSLSRTNLSLNIWKRTA